MPARLESTFTYRRSHVTTIAHRTVAAVPALVRYYDRVAAVLRQLGDKPQPPGFHPGFELPPLSDQLAAYLDAAQVRLSVLDEVYGRRLTLLDLTANPATRTTKTVASLLIVARAVRYIRRTGEPVMIVTPSSANKATALRDAVLRAYRHQLATPAELRIVTVVPETARDKLWRSDLDGPALAAANPMCVHAGRHPADVKRLAEDAVRMVAARLRREHGINVWYSLGLDNYRPADTVRAFVEHEFLPVRPGSTRCHAHSVSSAYGLLGHHLGTSLLPAEPNPSGYLLVQHLATPDMVLSLHRGGTERSLMPQYHYDPTTGLFRQHADPRFPYATLSPDEDLEPTFYTRSPVTSPAMNEIIRRQGGGGIVVSLHECLQRYAQVRQLLLPVQVSLPADPRRLREWSLVMAFTGVLNAIERGLTDADDIVVHGSGSYSVDDFSRLGDDNVRPVANTAALAEVLMAAGATVVPR
jgi:hypothetical protein